jgi:glycerol uptake facilitator protein
MGIYLTARISGAHLNPAVTLTLAVLRGFSWAKVVPYSVAQILGGFVGAAITYTNYHPAILKMDPDLSHTAGIFTTFPAFPDLPMAGFVDQVIGTAILLLLIFALSDERNLPPGSNLSPILVGLVVVLIGMSFGALHGYAINPARDFGPRLFTAVAGFKNNGLTDSTGRFWVPLIAPLVGGLIGGATYDFFIRKNLTATTEIS